jgi:hypothetical protein
LFRGLVGSEMCIRDRHDGVSEWKAAGLPLASVGN